MLRIMALVFIAYGLFDIFMKNFRRASQGNVQEPRTVQARIQRVKTVLPAYLIVLVGAMMLLASFAR